MALEDLAPETPDDNEEDSNEPENDAQRKRNNIAQIIAMEIIEHQLDIELNEEKDRVEGDLNAIATLFVILTQNVEESEFSRLDK